MELAAEKRGSIAFSCLSTGVYGYPSGEAAEVALGVVRDWLVKQEEEEEGEEGPKLERIVFCCFEAKDENAYSALIPYVQNHLYPRKTLISRLLPTQSDFPERRRKCCRSGFIIRETNSD